MIQQILVDMIPFILILATSIFAFGFFFMTFNPYSPSFGPSTTAIGPLWPFVNVFLMTLGSFDITDFPSPLEVLMFMLCTLFTTVLLLNLLIAIMSDSYEYIKESEVVEELRGRANIIVQHERTSPAQCSFFEYMHILCPAEEKDDRERPWEGVAGKIRNEVAALRSAIKDTITKTLRENTASIESRIDGIERKLDMMHVTTGIEAPKGHPLQPPMGKNKTLTGHV